MEPSNTGKSTDVVIIGAGIAGLTAAIYLQRGSADFLLLEKGAPGGRLLTIAEIDNYPSEEGISGPLLASKIYSHAQSLGINETYANVLNVSKSDSGFDIDTDVERIHAKAIIVATGTLTKQLGVPGEKEFFGRGVSYCATCDGSFYKGKPVALYGHNDRAIEEALYLSKLVSHLYFLLDAPLEGAASHVSMIKKTDNVTLIEKAKLISINGEKKVSFIVYQADEKENSLDVDAIFPLGGEKSSTDFLSSLKAEGNRGFLIVSPSMETSIPGLFAAGDIVDKKLRQLVTASSDGAIAANSVLSYLRTLR